MTSAADARSLAEELATQMAGETVRAVVLHGSLVLDAYIPGASDVDLLVIGNDAAVIPRRDVPVPVDIRVVTPSVAADPPDAPPLEAYVRLTPGREPRDEGGGPEPDLVIELALCRAVGDSLVGPPPTELIGDIDPEAVLRAADRQLAAWQRIGDDPPWAQLTVLTACRAWLFAEERRHASKREAAEWALARDPELTAIPQALRQQIDPRAEIDPAGVAAVLTAARRALR